MVSVCMATYNGERFLREQIDSILIQLAFDDELIISDDGSTDSTLLILDEYRQKDKRIKVLHHVKSPDVAKKKYSRNFYYATQNFENALQQVKGEYIFLSDQDDVWMPGKVKKMCSALKNFDCVMCNNQIILADGRPVGLFWGKTAPYSSHVLINMKRTPFLGCCMAMTRKSLEYILPFPEKLLCHDLWIGCLTAHRESLFYLEEPLHKYRYHENSVSPSVTASSKNPLFFKIGYRIVFLCQFFQRAVLHKSNI